ncbi:DNA translocase FtsK [Streptohalobacillus salinus]|uniref:DNA translocase FtsK n=1 Tax=Streptohalobacillus salinus TaxID=621096 RepID=A0A2V3WCM4_9BACI|nr:DNA translocase FtsK [Streptohalobacillus salinus]PXW92480.1 DNA translocase FtsK [Streptohalobacillus salinus]
MVRKKQTNKSKKKNPNHTLMFEIYGVLFILVAVFGSGIAVISDGVVPSFILHTNRFLMGVFYFIIPATLIALGLYIMIRRQWPVFLTRRFLGLVFLLVGLSMLAHYLRFDALLAIEDVSIVNRTWADYQIYLDEGSVTLIGGGIIGALFFAVAYHLLGLGGALFLSVFLIIVAVVFVADVDLQQLSSWLIQRIKRSLTALKTKWIDKKAEQRTRKDIERSQRLYQSDGEGNAETTESEEPVIEAFTAVSYHDEIDNPNKEKAEAPAVNADQQIATDITADEALDKQLTTGVTAEVENKDYQLPPISLLQAPTQQPQTKAKGQIQSVVKKLEATFQSFGVKAKVTRVHVGPAVTKYEVYPEAGVKVSKIVNLHDDLALALAAKDIRIEAPIPGKSAVGIEVPNDEIAMVTMREVFETVSTTQNHVLSFVLGRDISGEAIKHELNKMPHLLVAGATGSGKSVCINGIIVNILMQAKPHEVKLMMIDPKKVELNVYNGIPHLLAPVVTDPKKAAQALKKVVSEMERRYDLFSDTGNRNIEGYNNYVKKYNQTIHDEEEKQPLLPYIVVLVDELADLMMVASNDVEDAITRLAQMARAAGIHLIIATQRPSVDVITGVIKANIPSRIAFSVSSQTDSRTILDGGGAEKLLGRGDMLFMPVGASKPTRIQGAFLSDEEVEAIVDFCIDQQKAQYQEEMIPEEIDESVSEIDDEYYEEAVQLVLEMQTASVSMLQRRFRIGYNRAARLIDAMEARGVVGPHEGSKPRTVLIDEYSD